MGATRGTTVGLTLERDGSWAQALTARSGHGAVAWMASAHTLRAWLGHARDALAFVVLDTDLAGADMRSLLGLVEVRHAGALVVLAAPLSELLDHAPLGSASTWILPNDLLAPGPPLVELARRLALRSEWCPDRRAESGERRAARPGTYRVVSVPCAACPHLGSEAVCLSEDARVLQSTTVALELRPIERDILRALVAAPGRWLSSAVLQHLIWGRVDACSRASLRQHVYTLRRRCEMAGLAPPIESRARHGYRLGAWVRAERLCEHRQASSAGAEAGAGTGRTS